MPSDLSAVILAGTQSMSQAAQNLGGAIERKQARKRVALETVMSAFKDASKTYKENKDWAEAKAAEDDVKQVNDAYTLGNAHGGIEGGQAAIAAQPTKTYKGSAKRVELSTMLDKRTADKSLRNYQDAQTFSLTQKQDQYEQEQSAIQDAVRKHPFKNQALNDYYGSGYGDPSTFHKAVADEMTQTNQQTRDTAKADRDAKIADAHKALEEQRQTGRVALLTAKNEYDKTKTAEQNTESKRRWELEHSLNVEAGARAEQTLLVHATHLENVDRLDKFSAELRGVVHNNEQLLRQDSNVYDHLKDELDVHIATAKIMLDEINKQTWMATDDENKAALQERARVTLEELKTEGKRLDSIPRPVMQPLPQVPNINQAPPRRVPTQTQPTQVQPTEDAHASGASPADVQELEAAGMVWNGKGWVTHDELVDSDYYSRTPGGRQPGSR